MCYNGNLDNMKWLKENGCEFDYDTFSSAVENGNLDNIKWLKMDVTIECY